MDLRLELGWASGVAQDWATTQDRLAGRAGRAEIQSTSWCQVAAPDGGLSAKGVPGANSLKNSLQTHSSLPICPVGSGTLLFYPRLGVTASGVQLQALWWVPCAVLKPEPSSHH